MRTSALSSARWLVLLALVIGCGDESKPDENGLGALQIVVLTEGVNLDAGYDLYLDGEYRGPFEQNDSLALDSVRVGNHSIQLLGVAANCETSSGNPYAFWVNQGGITEARIRVYCYADGPVRFIVSSTGPRQDPDGYRYGLDAEPSIPVGINDTVFFPVLSWGDHAIRIDGLAADCTAQTGTGRQVQFKVTGIDTLNVWLPVTCLSFAADHIVFASTRGGGTGRDDLEIWSIKTDGTEPLRLTNNAVGDDEPATSRGAYSIAFTRGSGDGPRQLWTMLSDGTLPDSFGTLAPDARTPAYRPDGPLSWVERIGDVYEVRLYDFFDGVWTPGPRARTEPTRRFSPSWSDDYQFVVVTDSSINLLDAYTPLQEVVLRKVAGVTHAHWSYSTHKIVFNAPAVPDPLQPGLHGTGAWVMNEDGSGLVQLMSATVDDAWNTPKYNPAGTQLVFSRVVGGGDSKIWIANADGSGLVEVAGAGNMNLHPAWR